MPQIVRVHHLGGRVVGIVSHGADLKDRVPERLEVRRITTGASTVTVVA